MHDRNRELNVAHAITTNFLLGNFYTTSITNDSFISDTLVFSAVTFKVLCRSKNPLTEQTLHFWLVRSVIDGLGLLYLSIGTA